METIILQIVAETAKKFLGQLEAGGIGALHRMAGDFREISDGMAREVLAAFIAGADAAVRDAREERMGDGIRIRESNVPRSLLTALGPFTYSRTYFDVPGGREFILDRILGVGAYERVDAGVGARLADEAAKGSYGRSAAVAAGGLVSRQTVRNKVMGTGEVAFVPVKAAETPDALHIFADEDRVAPRGGGKGAIVPLVTVCGGRRGVSAGRHALVDPFHVQGFGTHPGTLRGRVCALCAERYDMRAVRKVHIYGDGAAWIAGGADFFPGAVRVPGGFHLRSRLKRLFAGDAGQALAPRARAALAAGDRVRFAEAAGRIAEAAHWLMPAGRERAARIRAAGESAAYILNQWDAIMNMRLPDAVGSCTEAMAGHVLSERPGRNPTGWSRAGLAKVAMLRVFVADGGAVGPQDMGAGKGGGDAALLGKYDALVRRQQDEALGGFKDWGVFGRERMAPGKRGGTRVLIDALGKARGIDIA